MTRYPALVAALAVGILGLTVATADQAMASTDMPVIGHRGVGDGSLPENSRAAVTAALKSGTDGVEIDVRVTRDGKQIVMHDATLDRTTNCTGEVSGRTYSYIRTNCRLSNGEVVPNPYDLAWTFSKHDSKSDQLWLHVKFDPNSKQRASLFKAVDKYKLRTKTVVLADEGEMLDDFAKWSGIERALIFNQSDVDQGGSESWTAGYDYAVPYQVPVTASLVAKARKAGSKVYGLESNPVTRLEAIALGLDGFLANTL